MLSQMSELKICFKLEIKEIKRDIMSCFHTYYPLWFFLKIELPYKNKNLLFSKYMYIVHAGKEKKGFISNFKSM